MMKMTPERFTVKGMLIFTALVAITCGLVRYLFGPDWLILVVVTWVSSFCLAIIFRPFLSNGSLQVLTQTFGLFVALKFGQMTIGDGHFDPYSDYFMLVGLISGAAAWKLVALVLFPQQVEESSSE